jgi:hypothetical protein
MRATIRRAIRHDLRPTAGADDAGDVMVDLASHLPPGCSHITRPSRLNFHAVLGGVNALRSASTVRSALPSGVDPACAPLESGFCAMVEV